MDLRIRFALSPWWVHAIVLGAFFGLFMTLFSWSQTGYLELSAVGGLVGGAFFGITMSLWLRRFRRRSWARFGITDPEKTEVLHAMRSGVPCREPRLTEVARALLERQRRVFARDRRKYVVFFGLITLVYVILAVIWSRWWLLAVAVFAVMWIIGFREQRQRERRLQQLGG